MIVISGASGFVGQNLISYLDTKGKKINPLNLRDLNWKNLIPKSAQAIIHLAGKAHDTENASSDEEYFTINTYLTISLFKEFLKLDIRDFIYFSSVKAVADTVNGVLTEDADANPMTPYGKSKMAAEEYLLNQVLPCGKRLFIIRPCMIHGPGNKGNLNLLYNIVKNRIPWPLACFYNERSFLSIDNLSYLINEILSNEHVKSGVYNFADDDSMSTNELVTLMSETLNKKSQLWKIPSWVIRIVVKIGDILPLPLNSERLKKLTESYVVSNDKIKSELGITLLPTSTKEGLIKTIQSFKNE